MMKNSFPPFYFYLTILLRFQIFSVILTSPHWKLCGNKCSIPIYSR